MNGFPFSTVSLHLKYIVPFRQARLTSVVEGQCNSGGKGNTTDDGGSPPPICAPSHSLRERCPVSLRDSTRRGAL